MDVSTAVGGLLGCIVFGGLFRLGWLFADFWLDSVKSLFRRHD